MKRFQEIRNEIYTNYKSFKLSETMTNLSFSGKSIYVGIDVHKKSWEVKILTEHTTHRPLHLSSKQKLKDLIRYLRKNFPGATILCAYEAGFSGYWIQEELERAGIKTLVVHPADIPTSDKEKQFKTDRRDCLKIAQTLRSGLLEGIYIPTKEFQRDRAVVRQRYQVAGDQRRIKNRIKSHLSFFGIEINWEEGVNESYWSNRMMTNLERYAEQEDDQVLKAHMIHLRLHRELELKITRALRQISKKEKYQAKVQALRKIPGVGMLTLMTFLTEIMDINRFSCEDKLLSYVGLIPGSHSSGEREVRTRITNRGNKRVRTAMILSAWMAVRNDSGMALYYKEQKKNKCAQKAIVKVARKLIRKMRYELKQIA